MWHLVVCDGGRRGGIAYGSFAIYNDLGIEVEHQQFVIGNGTNNQAEYAALVVALTWCVKNNVMNIVVMSDSLLMVNQVLGTYECLNEGLKPLLKRVKRLQKQFKSFRIKHINNRYIKQKLGH